MKCMACYRAAAELNDMLMMGFIHLIQGIIVKLKGESLEDWTWHLCSKDFWFSGCVFLPKVLPGFQCFSKSGSVMVSIIRETAECPLITAL